MIVRIRERTSEMSEIEVKVFRICCHCNKEFEAVTSKIVSEAVRGVLSGRISSFQDCPLCKKRNDIWVRVQVTSAKSTDKSRQSS